MAVERRVRTCTHAEKRDVCFGHNPTNVRASTHPTILAQLDHRKLLRSEQDAFHFPAEDVPEEFMSLLDAGCVRGWDGEAEVA
jgi:hypothetical protein